MFFGGVVGMVVIGSLLDYKNCSTDENGGNDVKGIHSGLHEE